jgi:hypothetical protein
MGDGMTYRDPNGDILREIEREGMLIPEGTYEGEIIGISDIQMTKSQKSLYIRIGVRCESREMSEYLAGGRQTLTALKKCEPYLTGKKAMIKITHRNYSDHVYHTPTILWDEAFEELNGI